MIFNFKCTVLEDHWDYDARTGTKMKLESSTFVFSKQFLCWRRFSGWNTRKCMTHNEQKQSNSQSDPPLVYRKCWVTFSKIKISPLKNQNFTFRQLPSSKLLPVDVLSKNEQIRDRLECARPIPDDLPQKLGIETLTVGYEGRVVSERESTEVFCRDVFLN